MIVWQPIDAITVMPNTDYVFSAWVMNWGDTGNNLPELQFQINGVDISTPISPSATPCLWTQLSVTWNSGSSTSAVITLLNKQSAGGGNDFSIDDMSFHELGKIETYQFNVAVRNCSFTENKTMCSDETMLFNSSDNSVYTDILWSPATGLTGTTSSKPTFKPSSAGMHIFTFTGKNELGLTITKTFNVDVETCPFIETNVTTCLEETLVLNDDDTDVYTNIQWLPTTGLTGASTSKPTFKPIAVGNFTYTMKAEKSGVKVRKKIHVQVVQCIPPPPPPPPPVPIIPDKFFTPNNDGCNDVWTVQGLEEYSGIIVEIYDRAGVRLISFDGNFSGWDGKYNGQPMPAGDYWYVIAIGETAQRMVGHFVLRR
jgi:gliding motility-associated-like protein